MFGVHGGCQFILQLRYFAQQWARGQTQRESQGRSDWVQNLVNIQTMLYSRCYYTHKLQLSLSNIWAPCSRHIFVPPKLLNKKHINLGNFWDTPNIFLGAEQNRPQRKQVINEWVKRCETELRKSLTNFQCDVRPGASGPNERLCSPNHSLKVNI